jgi:gliding motility-associated-like protein
MKGPFLFFLFCLLLGTSAVAQVSPDCSTAIPICSNTPVNSGTDGYSIDDFQGASSSGCLEQTTSGAIESNSAWYRFRAGASGQLGFNIQHDPQEDWDFALYQTDDCGQLGEPVRCNFFDNRDENSYIGVGEDPTGDDLSVQYEDWLQVEAGQEYYLLINNFSNLNSGFSIQFSGSVFLDFPDTALDCSIVDNLLGSAQVLCEGESTELQASTPGALGYQWYADLGNGFYELTGEDNPTYTVTQAGVYRVVVDLPNLENRVSDVQVSYTPIPNSYPVQDEAYCLPLGGNISFDLSALDEQALGGQDPSQYRVTYHHSQQDANLGVGAFPQEYQKPAGSEVVYVRVSSRVNPNCYDASYHFQLSALSEPLFQFPLEAQICGGGSGVLIGESQPNPTYSYEWDNGETGAERWVNAAGEYQLTIRNTWGNAACESTRTIVVQEIELPVIQEIKIEDLRERNTVTVVMDRPGNYRFRLDDGPFQAAFRFTNVLPGLHRLEIQDELGCGMVEEEIVIVGYPANFTPNGDVLNEAWHIEGLEYLEDPEVMIFDRNGRLLKIISTHSEGWDGTFRGRPVPRDDYWFRLTYRDLRGNRSEAKYLRTHFALIR